MTNASLIIIMDGQTLNVAEDCCDFQDIHDILGWSFMMKVKISDMSFHVFEV